MNNDWKDFATSKGHVGNSSEDAAVPRHPPLARQHRHGPLGHPPRDPHHAAPHGHDHRLESHLAARQQERFVTSGGGFQGAAITLEKILPLKFVSWITRSISAMVCPPEMLALFRIHIATIEHLHQSLSASGVSIPHFDPVDLAEGEASLQALGTTLSVSHQRACLEDLMQGPAEVQAVGFVSLISLRLAVLASTSALNEEVEADV